MRVFVRVCACVFLCLRLRLRLCSCVYVCMCVRVRARVLVRARVCGRARLCVLAMGYLSARPSVPSSFGLWAPVAAGWGWALMSGEPGPTVNFRWIFLVQLWVLFHMRMRKQCLKSA